MNRFRAHSQVKFESDCEHEEGVKRQLKRKTSMWRSCSYATRQSTWWISTRRAFCIRGNILVVFKAPQQKHWSCFCVWRKIQSFSWLKDREKWALRLKGIIPVTLGLSGLRNLQMVFEKHSWIEGFQRMNTVDKMTLNLVAMVIPEAGRASVHLPAFEVACIITWKVFHTSIPEKKMAER